jgi:hypothetical protein
VLFFNAFFNADFVKAAMKIPTPYSWSRIGVEISGTIWVSIGLIMFLMFANVLAMGSCIPKDAIIGFVGQRSF